MESNEEMNIEEYRNEKRISINITVEKFTYFPGEVIKGFLYIKGKNLTNPLLLYALVNVTIHQKYYYEYELESKIESDTGEEHEL